MIYKMKYQRYNQPVITTNPIEADSYEEAINIFHERHPDCWLLRKVELVEEEAK